MDRVLVFHQGRIVEDGHPRELKTFGRFYATLQRASEATRFQSLS